MKVDLLSIKKGAVTALFLFLTGCCCPPVESDWGYDSSIARNPCQSSARIYLCSTNQFSGLEIEIVRTRTDLRMYLNVFGLEIPPDCNDPTISNVYISFRDHSYTFAASRFAGGQRLLLPESVRDEMTEYLACDQPVFIRVGRYEADIYPQHFLEVYNRLMHTDL